MGKARENAGYSCPQQHLFSVDFAFASTNTQIVDLWMSIEH